MNPRNLQAGFPPVVGSFLLFGQLPLPKSQCLFFLKGVQQGIQQNQNQMIERLLQKGESSTEEIASLVGVDIERVRKVAESIGHGF